MTPTTPQAITADQYEPRRMDDATFEAHDAALAQIDAHRERAEAIEAVLSRLAKAQRDLAAHAALPSFQTPPAWQDPERFTPSPLLRREILDLDATDDEKASLLAADWPSQEEQPRTTVDAMAAAIERLQALRREQDENAAEPCVSCGFAPSMYDSETSCDCGTECQCDPCRRARGYDPDADHACASCGEQYDMRPGSDICAPCAKQYDERARY